MRDWMLMGLFFAASTGSSLGAELLFTTLPGPAPAVASTLNICAAPTHQFGTKPQGTSVEPIFSTIEKNDREIEQAHRQCADSIGDFVRRVEEERDGSIYMAKLRFRDPDRSQREGRDSFFYLWLSEVLYHPKEKLLSGVFFEVPEGFDKWHAVGSRLGFDPEDVFDWMVIDDGRAQGGFTIRLTRARLGSDAERVAYDDYIGIESYEPIPAGWLQNN